MEVYEEDKNVVERAALKSTVLTQSCLAGGAGARNVEAGQTDLNSSIPVHS